MQGGSAPVTQRVITQFWLRRLCEAVLFLSGAVLVLYAWARFIPTGYEVPVGLAVTDVAAGVAALTSVLSLILCFWLPQKYTNMWALGVYLLAVAVIATLIVTGGGITSPFASGWFVIATFAGFFGLYVAGGMALLVLAQIILEYFHHALTIPTIFTYIFFGLTPVILSFILWHRQPQKHKGSDVVADLASKLSTVEGKSDVVINTIDDGVVAINRTGIIDLINPSAQELVGWSKGDALGLDWRSVLKLVNSEGREVPEMEHPIAQALATNKPTHSDILSLLTESGKKRLISIVSSPVGTNADGIIVVFRDITKEKAEEREQAEFISTASHEMRTPVASIEGYLGLALNPATANIDEKARDFITKAHESAQHLGRLFQDLLDISRAEDGRLKSEPQVIDVSAMTGDITEGLSHLASEKNLRILFKPNPSHETEGGDRRMQPVYYANVDPNHFREIVSNLVENAIKYTLQGDVVVDVTGDDKLVTVSVQDTGIGIPAEDIPHLFQKFYRVDNSDTREIGGTGLGLYLCRRLAETMSGNLRVESEYKKGSTFFLDVPRMSHEDAMQKLNELPEEGPEIIVDRPLLATPDQQTEGISLIETTEPTAPPATEPPAASPVATPVPAVAAPQPISIPVSVPEDPQPQTIPSAPVAEPAAPPVAPATQPPEMMTLQDIEVAVAAQPVYATPAPQVVQQPDPSLAPNQPPPQPSQPVSMPAQPPARTEGVQVPSR